MESRVAVLEDKWLAELYVERQDARSIVGSIFKGRVENVLPGMDAAFVDIGLGKNGFLYVDEVSLPEAVSYTHLRAHETDSYLVCRLLLEKKKKTMTVRLAQSQK